jgi:Protein of unknown function (DUF2911)
VCDDASRRAGTPLWRAGANQTTVLKTEAPLAFGGKTVPAGEYGLLIDLRSPSEWTLIRVPMQVNSKVAARLDQLTIYFVDVTRTAGKLAIAWDTTVATAEFKVG